MFLKNQGSGSLKEGIVFLVVWWHNHLKYINVKHRGFNSIMVSVLWRNTRHKTLASRHRVWGTFPGMLYAVFDYTWRTWWCCFSLICTITSWGLLCLYVLWPNRPHLFRWYEVPSVIIICSYQEHVSTGVSYDIQPPVIIIVQFIIKTMVICFQLWRGMLGRENVTINRLFLFPHALTGWIWYSW